MNTSKHLYAMRLRSFLLALLLVVALPNLFAWGQKGHRVVAQLAYERLSSKAKRQIDATLGKGGMIYWCNWADEIKSDTVLAYTYDWHYQDLPSGLAESSLVVLLQDYPTEGGNLFHAMADIVAGLQQHTDSISVLAHRLSAKQGLILLIHLAADRFCPMHTGHLDDLGGNKVKMKWFAQSTNLHSVWDDKLIESRGLSYTEYALWLNNRYATTRDSLMAMTEQDILCANYALTRCIYRYQNDFDGNTYHYIYRFKDDLDRQLFHAGTYLANLLNKIYR